MSLVPNNQSVFVRWEFGKLQLIFVYMKETISNVRKYVLE